MYGSHVIYGARVMQGPRARRDLMFLPAPEICVESERRLVQEVRGMLRALTSVVNYDIVWAGGAYPAASAECTVLPRGLGAAVEWSRVRRRGERAFSRRVPSGEHHTSWEVMTVGRAAGGPGLKTEFPASAFGQRWELERRGR